MSSLTLSDRFHNIVRQTSIKTIYDALVELVTNSVDAYARSGKSRRDILISISRSDKTSIKVIDQATGMDFETLVKNLTIVGNYTSGVDARGMMGRGAKDCSILGDISFLSVFNEKQSKIIIYQNGTYEILIENEPVSDNTREYISENGTLVELICANSLVPEYSVFYSNFSKNVSCRNIFNTNTIVLQEGILLKRLEYIYLPRELIISCEYDIPEYNTTARLEIYKSDLPQQISKCSDQIEYGILVCSNRSVFECSALYYSSPLVQDYIWNINTRYITGVLICDDIEKIALEAANGNLSLKNPFLCIDPNRRNGLAKDHPFTKALFEPSYKILEMVINRMQDNRDENLLDTGEAKNFFDTIDQMLSKMLPAESVLYTWRSKNDHQNLIDITKQVKNVSLNNDFMGLSWEDAQKLNNENLLTYQQEPPVKNSFNVSFTDDKNVRSAYQILYMPGRINLKINTNDSSLKPFISVEDGKVNFINYGKSLVSVGNIITEAANNMILRRRIMNNQTNSLDMNSFNEFIFNNNDIRSQISSKIFNNINSSISALKDGTFSL